MSGHLYPDYSTQSGFSRLQKEDEREVLERGTNGLESTVEKQPILGSYLPVHPVQKYTLKKWRVDDWKRHIDSKCFQSVKDKESSRTLREETKELINHIDKTSHETQATNTECIGDRIQNIKYWKFELEQCISNLTNELLLLKGEHRRLEIAIQSLQKPLGIAQDCLSHRQRKIDYDLVQDEVEVGLLKEMSLISEVRQTLSEVKQDTASRIATCQRAKDALEHDWSNKLSSHNLESKNVSLKNSRKNHMYKPGVACYHERESLPENWLEFSQNNLRQALQEIEDSIRLRGVINHTLAQSSGNLRQQADTVVDALNRRIAETEDAYRKLEIEQKTIVNEITSMENLIAQVDESHWNKQAPLKVVQSRLNYKHKRPHVEMCRDDASHGLIDEVKTLENSLQKLEMKSVELEDHLRKLNHSRTSLEKEIDIKKKSISLDRDRCLKLRAQYPSLNVLCGYQ